MSALLTALFKHYTGGWNWCNYARKNKKHPYWKGRTTVFINR